LKGASIGKAPALLTNFRLGTPWTGILSLMKTFVKYSRKFLGHLPSELAALLAQGDKNRSE